MPKEEKKRTFESESLILPALKMVLVEEKDAKKQPGKAIKEKAGKDFTEDTVLRIIGKLSSKD
jgi:hypothetical protein